MEDKKTIVQNFQEIAKKYPSKLCLVSYDWQCSYKQLDDKSNCFAKKINETLGKTQTPILVFCDSPKVIAISLLSILKSRNIYVPVYPLTPLNRVKEIIKECNIKAYISKNEHKELNLTFINLDCKKLENYIDFAIEGDFNDIAYIIYTSGTTGKSKGVAIQYKGLTNAILQRNKILDLNENSNSILLMGLTFDGFFTSFFCPLVLGATLYFPNDIFDINRIESFFANYDINNFLCTPTMFRTLLNLNKDIFLKKIKLVSLAGEAVDKQLIKECLKKYPNLQIANEYGPSENSICTSIKADIRNQEIISVGKTIKNVEAKIFDKEFISKKNKIGELYLSGIGLSVGYINDENLTKCKFVTINNKVWYKTGDLAYLDNNNEIVIVGREDSQVKINGFRVDLLELQNAIFEYSKVKSSVVVYDKQKGISAYYVSNFNIEKQKLIDFLKSKLNDYMIPNNFFQIKSIPVLESGKIDLIKLKEIGESEDGLVNFTPEYKKLLNKIYEIFKEVLKVDKVSEGDSFFSLGGNSLNCVILIEKIKQLYNLELDYDIIRVNSTPKMLALALLNKKTNVNKNYIKPFNRFWFVDCYFTSILAFFEKEKREIAPFIRAFKIKGVELNNTYQFLYENKKPLKEIFSDFAMEFDAGILENDFSEKVLPFVSNNKPVMLHVDCFYLPYCKEKYKKEHFEHVIALVNFDEQNKVFDVIDQENLQSVSFCYHKLNLLDAEIAAYAEIINRETFDNVDFVSIYPSLEKKYETKKIEKLDKTQFDFVIKSTIEYLNNKEIDILIVLQRLINYCQIEKEVFKYEKDEQSLNDCNKKEAKLKRLLMSCLVENDNILNKNKLLDLLNLLIGDKHEN